jgi:hypothetical protein
MTLNSPTEFATSFDTGILAGDTKRFCGDTLLVSTLTQTAALGSDIWRVWQRQAFLLTGTLSGLNPNVSVWGTVALAAMGVSRTTFGTSPESQVIVQNEGLGIRHSIQRALWNAYYGYAGHTTIHGWGSVICFPAPGRSYGAQSDWGFRLSLVNSTPDTWTILQETLDSRELATVLRTTLEHLCYSTLQLKLQRMLWALERREREELERHPNYRKPVMNDDF